MAYIDYFNNVLYAVVPIGLITSEVIEKSTQTSIDTLRKNVLNTHAVIKFLVSVAGIPPLSDFTQYTWTEIQTILSDAKWQTQPW